MAELQKVDLESKDLVAEGIEQMKALFPEIATEGDGAIDFEKLRLLLGDEVEDGNERYSFTWPGKRDALRQSQTTSTATLRPMPNDSVNWDTSENLYIEGDNLEVLKLLQKSYHGKVKLIYIDPPYNTGKDFVYRDKFGDTLENYREQANLTGQSNADTSGRYHSDWCSMIYPRIRLARGLLADNGLLFISIDDNELTNMRLICDEIFGQHCFVNCIAVKMSEASGLKMAHVNQRLPKLKEYVLVYRKLNISLNAISVPKDKWDDEYRSIMLGLSEEQFQFIETVIHNDNRTVQDVEACKQLLEGATYTTLSQYYSQNGITRYEDKIEFQFANSYRIFQTVSMGAGATNAINKVRHTLKKGVFFPYMTSEGAMYVIKGDYSLASKKPRMQVLFAKDYLTVHPGDFWQDIRTTGLDNEGYVPFKNGKKPLKLLQRILATQSFEDDDIVMDFFSGSGTTAEACFRQSKEDGIARRFILIQLPESLDVQYEHTTGIERRSVQESIEYLDEHDKPHTICELAKQRIRSAGNDLRTLDSAQDLGFRSLKLDSSGINQPEEGQLLIDRIKHDRTDLDIVFEMMLKWGLELTYSIEEDEIEGYPVYSIASDELICCMQPGLTTDVLEAIAARMPRRVFILDSVIDDTVKLNALQIFERAERQTQQPIELRTV